MIKVYKINRVLMAKLVVSRRFTSTVGYISKGLILVYSGVQDCRGFVIF